MLKNKEKISNIFVTSVKALKDAFPKYRHLLLSTGLEDDLNYDMNDETSFSLDSNLAEFTDYAVRLSIIQYLYNYPTLNFDINLLEQELNIFTFSQGIFQEGFLNTVKKYISLGQDFFFPFLPISGSSHWYTLIVSSSSKKIIIINPLEDSHKNEQEYLLKIMLKLSKHLDVKYKIFFENAGIQTSGKSCGESTLLIFFSFLQNGGKGYRYLIKHLHKDLPIINIFELKNIVFGNFCKCEKCMDDNIPFEIIQTCYVGCKTCKSLNVCDSVKCVRCNTKFDNNNSEKFYHNTSKNRKNMEISIRMGLLNAVEKCDPNNPDNICIK